LKQIKIIGSGSIGTHHAHAARQLGWDVTVVDVDRRALDRMRTSLFPSRYGQWDPQISLVPAEDEPRGGFDLIVIGTPPDSHLPLALKALEEAPQALLIEKPLAPPMSDLAPLARKAAGCRTRVFVGYDHVVGRAAQEAAREVANGFIGNVITIDVEFREHWAGIFQAHPWLSGPSDSYLGFWKRGGGASGEHSHAMNLWQYFARVTGAGRVERVQAALDYVTEGGAAYDRLCVLTLRTDTGLIGRVVQDVVTRPPRKWARIQGDAGAIEWHAGYQPGADAVVLARPGAETEIRVMPKTRPDDFIDELRHLDQCCRTNESSPIDLEWGIETTGLLTAAHESMRAARGIPVGIATANPTEARY
jgi:predicted dehydrogenase